MHDFFIETRDDSYDKKKKFSIIIGPIHNMFKTVFPKLSEKENCAKWISQGLEKAGIVTHTFVLPKSIFINIFENQPDTDVIFYVKIEYCSSNYAINAKPIELVSPLQFIRSYFYHDTKGFANAVVKYSEKDKKINVERIEQQYKPSATRNIINNKYIATSTSIGAGVLMYRTYKNPTGIFKMIARTRSMMTKTNP